MKKAKETTDKSAPYRSLGLNKITAPVKASGEPQGSKIVGTNDLRAERGGKACTKR